MGKLTDSQIRRLRIEKEYEFLGDGNGLYLRAYRSGRKVWVYRYKNPAGRTTWLELKDYGSGGDNVTFSLAQARLEAAQLTLKRRQGIDPVEELQNERAIEEAREKAEKEAADAHESRLTVSALFDRWKTHELSNRKTEGETVRGFSKDVLPAIGHLAAQDVRKSHIMAIVDAILLRGATRQSTKIFSDLRQMFSWALARDLVETDPTATIQKSRIATPTERDRTLSLTEVQQLAKIIPVKEILSLNQKALPLSITGSAAVWICLSTGCRIGELLGAQWGDIDLTQNKWILPATKNGKSHTIWLSDFTTSLFQVIFKITGKSAWVYPNRDGESPVWSKTIAKQIHDRQIHLDARLENRTKNTSALMLAGGKWTMHDLRRTAATIMGGQLNISPHVIEKVLNHTEPNKIGRIYQRQTYESEQRQAWQALGKWLTNQTRLEHNRANGDKGHEQDQQILIEPGAQEEPIDSKQNTLKD